jgi:hypothetical protein
MKAHGVVAEKEEDDDDDDPEMLALLSEGGEIAEGGDDDEPDDDEAEKAAVKKKEKEQEEEKEVIEKQKNWSSVNIICKESKLAFQKTFTQVTFTNWLWWRCIRPKLEETKSRLPELEEEELFQLFNVHDGEEVLGEYMPSTVPFPVKIGGGKDKKEKDDKKDKEDDKKDKKEEFEFI